MTVYALFIEDDRYSVPTLAFIKGDGHGPRRWAQEYLEQSPHYLSVEVRADEKVVAKVTRSQIMLGRGAPPPRTPGDPH